MVRNNQILSFSFLSLSSLLAGCSKITKQVSLLKHSSSVFEYTAHKNQFLGFNQVALTLGGTGFLQTEFPLLKTSLKTVFDFAGLRRNLNFKPS